MTKRSKLSAATEEAIMTFIANSKELRRSCNQLQFLILTNFSRLLAIPNNEWTDLSRALDYLTKAVTLDATNTAVWCQLARIAQQCEKPAVAFYAYEQGLLTKMAPYNLNDTHSRASWASLMESLSDTWSEHVTRLTPYGWECLLGLCQILFDRGDIRGCQQLIAPILDVYPNIPIKPQLRVYIEKMQAIQKEMEERLVHLDATWMNDQASITIGHGTNSQIDTTTTTTTTTASAIEEEWPPMTQSITRPTWAALGKAIGHMIEATEPR
ncbi:hypothetical protein BDF22DRAFT_317832 [Syncephalis plumigaleata]|nr:hypothetical protein BDF22DRAFT_317832 [Syncephalis plumigaleata]